VLLVAAALVLSSPAFANGAGIPVEYTCKGRGLSPPLRWSGPPPRTRSFTLTVVDPDAPGGRFVHWRASGIPAAARGLRAGQHAPVEGTNSAGGLGWTPPCPPAGPAHHYVFTLQALGPDSKVLATARLVGRYTAA